MLNKAHTTSKRQDYETPYDFFRRVEKFLGVTFTIDLAASRKNTLCGMYYTEELDPSFCLRWDVPQVEGRVCAGWCNPPYGDKRYPVSKWVKRPLSQYNYVFLLPCNKLDQAWVYEIQDQAAWIFVTGRLQFTIDGKRPTRVTQDGKVVRSGNSQGSILLCMGPHFKTGTNRYVRAKEV